MDPISLLVGGAAGAGLASVLRKGQEHRSAPQGLSDLLNWAFLIGDGVVLQKDGALLAGFTYRGPDLGSATPAELDALGAQLNDALLPYTDGWMFHVDSIRAPAPPYGPSAFPDDVSAWIDAERRAAFRSARPQFVSECTLTVTYLPPREAYTRAASLFLQNRRPVVDWDTLVGQFESALETLRDRLRAHLTVQRLGSDDLVTHLHRCLTGIAGRLAAPPHGAYLNTVLASQEVVGGFAPRVGALHHRIVGIVGYPAKSSLGRLEVLNTLPMSYRWSSRFIPVGQRVAEKLIRRHQQRWFMGRRGVGSFLREIASKSEGAAATRRQDKEEEFFYDQDATRMARDAGDAAAENASGAVRFGFATQVVVVADEDPRAAESNARAVMSVLQDHGFAARIETVNALDAFFGTLPGHGYPNLRRPLLSTANMVDLWPVRSVWPGLAQNPSPFFPTASPALAHVATDGSTPFRLNLHVGDVGHTLLVGATGAGKSTFVGLVAAQWQRYPAARTVIFDVGYSHWLLCRAVGGRHYDIGAGHVDALAFQPLADVDQPTERAWAAGWLEMLLELQGAAMTPKRRARVDRALVLLGQQPRSCRTLTELTVQIQDADLAAALRPYTLGGVYGRLLDASDDSAVLGNTPDAAGRRLVSDAERPDTSHGTRRSRDRRYDVFELRHLLDLDEKILVPVLLYLFRHVERRLDGHPTLIVIEELWAPLMRTVFSSRIKQWLLTLRKQNAAVMLVAHTPAQLDNVPAKQVLIESCPTRILLPNPEAEAVTAARGYRDLGLNDRELAIVARATPKRDYYVKSPQGNRLVRLDLGSVARAFLSTPDGMTLDATRDAVESLIAREGGAWHAAWLRRLGLEPPVVLDPRTPPFGVPNATENLDGQNVEVNHRMEDATNAGFNSAELSDLYVTDGIGSTSDVLEDSRRV